MKPAKISTLLWWEYNYHFVMEHLLGYKKFTSIYGDKHKKLLKNIAAYIENNLQKSQDNEVLFIDGNSVGKTDFRKPVLYRAKAAGWASTQKWDLDFFAEKYGDKEIILNDNEGLLDKKSPQQFETLKVRDYIRQIQEGSLKYLKFSSLVQKEQSLQDDLDLESLRSFLLPTSFGETLYMFMGGKGSITPMHNELASNVYVQISGQKKWILYPTEDRVFLNPRTERRPYFFSSADPNDTNNSDYPLQKYARKIEIILNPGDVLRVPPFYWHYIENVTDSIGVAYKFANIPKAIESSKMILLLFLLSTKPSMLSIFLANRVRKDDYFMTKKQSDLQ